MQKVFFFFAHGNQARKSICEPDDPRCLRVLLFEVAQALRVSNVVNVCYLLCAPVGFHFRGPTEKHQEILKIEVEVLLAGM